LWYVRIEHSVVSREKEVTRREIANQLITCPHGNDWLIPVLRGMEERDSEI
jgi:hypothetical protein